MENEIFKDSNISKSYLRLSLPLVLSMAVALIYNLADTYFVAQSNDTNLVAGVSLGMPLFTLLMAFGNIFGQGGSSLISRLMGQKDEQGVRCVSSCCFYVTIFAGILIAAVMLMLRVPLLYVLGASEETFVHASNYYIYLAIGAPFIMVSFIHSNLLRAEGMSKESMAGTLIGTVVNIILDPIFISVLGWGASGAAIATVLSQAVSALLVTRALMKCYGILKLDLRSIRFHADMLRPELRIGLPGGLQSFGYSISNIIIQAVINDFGTDTAAAWAAFGKMDAIFWTVCGSFGIAITTFAGQNYGARKYDRVKKSVRVSLGMSLGVCTSLIIFLMVFCRPLYVVFTADQNVIDIGVYMLRLITPSYIIFIFVEIFSGALRGIGDVLIPSAITLGGVLLVRLTWILLVTPMTGQLSTLMYSYPLAWGATALLLVPYYFHRRKKLL